MTSSIFATPQNRTPSNFFSLQYFELKFKMRCPLKKRFGCILPPTSFVYFTDRTENGHFAILGVFLMTTFGTSQFKSLISIKKIPKKVTDQTITVCKFPDRYVKYKKRHFYISELVSAIDLKFSPEKIF